MRKNQNLQSFLLAVFCALLIHSGGVYAVVENNSGSKATLQQLEQEAADRDQADQLLQLNIDNIQLITGPTGPQGSQGTQGMRGDVGPAGLTGPSGLDAPNRTADICALYQQLRATSLLGSLTVPGYCEPNNEAEDSNTVFVTSSTYSGNLGGLAGADDKCMSNATNAGFTGTYKAWLSDGQTSAGERLTHSNLPYVLTNGTLIANDWQDLTDGEIAAPINIDEFKQLVTVSSNQFVYSNTNSDGSRSQSIAFWTCDNWTREVDGAGFIFGRVGDIGAVDINWANTYVTLCAKANHLYCIEQ